MLKKKIIATVGIEPTTLALLAPRSNQTELYGYVTLYRKSSFIKFSLLNKYKTIGNEFFFLIYLNYLYFF